MKRSMRPVTLPSPSSMPTQRAAFRGTFQSACLSCLLCFGGGSRETPAVNTIHEQHQRQAEEQRQRERLEETQRELQRARETERYALEAQGRAEQGHIEAENNTERASEGVSC